jgi:TfoX/Sxy family transcriptional regulator of competence genes
MAIIALKAWYLEQYEPLREVVKRPHDLRLSRNSLLKSGLRADFLEDSLEIQGSKWFGRYLEGETVEFYIEGSGSYSIANIDLISHEIYFSKREVSGLLEPTLYLAAENQAIEKVVAETLEGFNQKARLPLSLVSLPHLTDKPLRLSDSQLRQIKKSLLFVADLTPLAQTGEQLLFSPTVCVELGYAIQIKPKGQILLLSEQRPHLGGKPPFDFPQHQQLSFAGVSELEKTFPPLLEALLQRFNLVL